MSGSMGNPRRCFLNWVSMSPVAFEKRAASEKTAAA